MRGKWSVDGCQATRNGPRRSAFAATLVVFGLLMVGLTMLILAVPAHASAFSPSGSALDPTTPWFYVMLIGILLVVIVLVAAALMRQIHVKATLGIAAVGFVLIIAALLGPVAFPAANTACIAGGTGTGCTSPSGSAVSFSSNVNTGALTTGMSCNTITYVCTVDLVYNSTGGALYVAPKLGFTGSGTAGGGTGTAEACGASTACRAYFVLPWNIVRTDSYNATQAITGVVNNLPTLTSTGTNPTNYGPIGYTAATSSAPGTWQFKWSTGSLSGSFPTQNAPTITTGVGSDVMGVQSFGSIHPTVGFTLAGSNSTSATWGTLATNFTAYPFQVAFQGGTVGVTPPSWTFNLVLIGWTK